MLLAPAAALQGCGARPAELLPCLALAPRAQEGSLWNGASAVAVVVGQAQEGLRYLKSISLHHWLLGYEFTGGRALAAAAAIAVGIARDATEPQF